MLYLTPKSRPKIPGFLYLEANQVTLSVDNGTTAALICLQLSNQALDQALATFSSSEALPELSMLPELCRWSTICESHMLAMDADRAESSTVKQH